MITDQTIEAYDHLFTSTWQSLENSFDQLKRDIHQNMDARSYSAGMIRRMAVNHHLRRIVSQPVYAAKDTVWDQTGNRVWLRKAS